MKRLNHKAEHKRHLPEPSARLHQQIGLPERPAFPNVLPNPHARRIQIRAKGNDTSIFCRIRFHSLKYSLCILNTPAHSFITMLASSVSVPSSISVFIICNISLICLYIFKSYICPVKIFLFHNKAPPFLHFRKQSLLSLRHYNTAVFKNQECTLFFSCTIFSYHFSAAPFSLLLINMISSEVFICKIGVHST